MRTSDLMRHLTSYTRLRVEFVGAIFFIYWVGTCHTALASEPGIRDTEPSVTWAGFYFGSHFSYGDGTFGRTTNPVFAQALFLPSTVTGFFSGYQIGYNFVQPNNFMFGLEADISFISPIDQRSTPPAPFNTTWNYFATARARGGYAFGPLLPFITGGLAWGRPKIEVFDSEGSLFDTNAATRAGWVMGAGVEYAVDANWRIKFEYDYIKLGWSNLVNSYDSLTAVTVNPTLHLFKVGLNYRPYDISLFPNLMAPSAPKSETWDIHAQTTFVQQGYPRFRSPYQGQNSLPGAGLGRETWTNTVFLGWRIWQGGELYFNPELAQGFGIGETLGLAGFSNGEAQKGGAPYPRVRAQRYFLRQTFGFGGEQETVEAGPNQLASKRDIDRITITVGRFAVGDHFDQNAYAHDPRVDFMNWSMWAATAYDFPADLPGFTQGAVIEVNRKNWTFRAGYFQVPAQQSSDVLTFDTGGGVVEHEQRYDLFAQPGKVRIGAFYNQARMGNYDQALSLSMAAAYDIDTAMVLTRQQRPKYGVYANIEQAINKDVGVFGRVSWNDGKNETLSFTDVDRSMSGGVSIKGSAWQRPDDTIGIGAAKNWISDAHRNFLSHGGMGLVIGDGALAYRPESIFETFYSFKFTKLSAITFDYQYVTNPAYNADRGPVHIFAGRFHSEF